MAFSQTEVWVSASGNDFNKGTKSEPLKSIDIAIRKVRDLRRVNDAAVNDDAIIYLTGGTYFLNSTLKLRSEDAGTENSMTIIKGVEDEKVVVSGGTSITGWKKLSKNVKGLSKIASKNVWVANIPIIDGTYLNFRQLWVNNKKAVRASNLDAAKLDRILGVDKQNRKLIVPNLKYNFSNIDDVEFVIHQWWAIANLKMQSIVKNKNGIELTFKEPASQVEFEHPWPAPFIDEKKEYNGNSAFYWVGAIELLDHAGEWYADFRNGLIYYWPRNGEDLKKDQVIVPVLESLVEVKGSLDAPVAYVKFENISFEHATWLRPSKVGHVPLQAGFYMEEAYSLSVPGTPDKAGLENQAWLGRQGAAFKIQNAHHIFVTNCVVKHVAATGIDIDTGVQNVEVIGNVFTDVGGTAIQAGFFGNSSFEAHLPYNPTDSREVVSNIRIANNIIQDATNEDWGCVGIGIGYAKNVSISHNDISEVNYSAISLGWGWTKTLNCMKNNIVEGNRIHKFAYQMYDVAGIYTLSAQPGTVIKENAIYDLMKAPYAHMPHHKQYIYLDEGSAYMRIENNWTEIDKFFCNANGPGNMWENNGVEVSETIKNNAGLEPKYQYLFDKLTDEKTK
ncbi:pectin lyase [Neptunitalea sp. Y10]|uniref:Pectin lyase n=1 Tax=Neptunitalea lumnitzerae TaxID=2965509 RepID=A0ABQ5MJR0_9FLAO|nr:pectin lyase [Neptunitalea sp. Y10]